MMINCLVVISEKAEETSSFGGVIKLTNSLSNRARTLLTEAANDLNGQIMGLDTMEGFEIQTNGKQVVKDNDPRSKALWTSALDELENKGLINGLGSKRGIFEMTNIGYQVDESLKNKTTYNKSNLLDQHWTESNRNKKADFTYRN